MEREQTTRDEQAGAVAQALRRHVRVAFQELMSTPEHMAVFRRSLPHLVPFGGNSYAGFLPVLDWDHRLPSQAVVLRIYAFYTDKALARGTDAFVARTRLIAGKDKFPEFDVPDYAGLAGADESYEGTVDPSGKVSQVQLLSEWRRNIDPKLASQALQAVRRSEEFRRVSLATHRPDYLGDLEATKWTPPCEGNHPAWTIDVWYLTEYNGMVGKGLSFLVDPSDSRLVNIREFSIRTG